MSIFLSLEEIMYESSGSYSESESESEKSTDSQIGLCDNCEDEIIYAKHAYYVLTKDEEEICWCQFCFDDLWKEMKNEGWNCDDFPEEGIYCRESEDSEDSEDSDDSDNSEEA